MKIAFLEDDAVFAVTTMEWLQQAGHDVVLFGKGRDCVRALADTHFDLCLLDWELPDLSGPDVMASLKLKGTLPPVIFLTGRDAEEDVIRMLEAGADDFIVKPPSRGILLARIQAAGRCCRTSRQPEPLQSIGEVKVDFNQRRFLIDDAVVNLTEKETKLALHFFSNIGMLLSRAHLIQVVWGSSPDIDTRTIDVHVSHLRGKLQLTAEHGWRLISVYQQGYRLERLEEYQHENS